MIVGAVAAARAAAFAALPMRHFRKDQKTAGRVRVKRVATGTCLLVKFVEIFNVGNTFALQFPSLHCCIQWNPLVLRSCKPKGSASDRIQHLGLIPIATERHQHGARQQLWPWPRKELVAVGGKGRRNAQGGEVGGDGEGILVISFQVKTAAGHKQSRWFGVCHFLPSQLLGLPISLPAAGMVHTGPLHHVWHPMSSIKGW
mmetsp:Transcript_14300/g.31710  ORF Transcript_14300/g.31710 Transcript_14300/m.31710 type:complete len:201 (-) Transcript_14300:667-1269(-)